ncbi:hypothetical protein VTI28DRAFT_405 [Corynascus sepedonium]
MVSANITELLATYIHALHILHYHKVLDGYGHLSVRNPQNSSNFFMMHQLAPAVVSGLGDISEYRVWDAEPVDPNSPDAPSERYIHSEILKRYSDVNVVLHGHADELVSYSISGVTLRSAIHMAPFLKTGVPIFDITKYYRDNDTHDFLVRNQRLGAALAAVFDTPDLASSTDSTQDKRGDHYEAHRRDDEFTSNEPDNDHAYPFHNLVLMQSHGFTAVATDIKIVTYEGIYAVVNARVQAEALKIQHAYTGQAAQESNGIVYLNERQVRDSWATEIGIVGKPWESWVREVKVDPLYVNELDSNL